MAKESPESRLARFEKENRIFFFEPYPWQKKALEMVHEKTTTALVSSNKIGKSCLVINILGSWVLGYEPWSYVEPGSEDGVEVGGQWYRKSSLGIEPPVDIILTGEDWKQHIGHVLIPEMKIWFPKGWYRTKKNEQGVEFFWEIINRDGTFKDCSTITLMSYAQAVDLFESFRIQGVILDEPPPRDKFKAMSRGLLLDNGKTLLSLTPIKEAWILDDIVLSGRRDVGIVQGLKITDNPDLYNSDRAVLEGLTEDEKDRYFDLVLYDDKEKGIPVSDRGARCEKFLESVLPDERYGDISKLKILKFIKDIDPADVPPRVFGEFKSLVGRVLKGFDTSVHVIEPFEVPTDWPVVPMIDFHLNTPQAISYWTTNKQEINYVIGETWDNISAEQIADDIIRKYRGGWNIRDAFIDPLSKGDTSYIRNRLGTDVRDTYSILEERLSEHGITLHVASKDKDSGIKNLQTWLRGANGLPTMYVFNTCERWLYEVMRWVFDDNGKPQKENDHFMENAYRFSLTGTRYDNYQIKPLPARQSSWNSAWMGA